MWAMSPEFGIVPAAAASHPAQATHVLWVFRDMGGDWCLREEGGATAHFATRDGAVGQARHLGRAWGSYTLYLELKDGRFVQEMMNIPPRVTSTRSR